MIPAERRSEYKRKPREERWSELLNVAAQVIYEKGYQAASLQEISDRLGIMKGSLYYYIRSKEDILFAVLHNIHEMGLANVTSLAAEGGTAVERLRRVIRGHILFIAEHLVDTTIFLHEMKALPADRQREILGGATSYPKLFRQLIAEGQAEGGIRRSLDTELTATIVLGSLNSTYRWMRAGDMEAAERIGAHFGEILISGLVAEEHAP